MTLPEWLPWWVVPVAFAPLALYLALFLVMPFHTFGLRGRLASLEAHLDEIHQEIRALTLRLPEPGSGVVMTRGARPPIPPAEPDDVLPRAAAFVDPPPRDTGALEPGKRGGGLGDPVADRMLAYMRDRAQSEVQNPGAPKLRPRTEPRLTTRLPPDPGLRGEPDLPPPPIVGGPPDTLPDLDEPPRPPRGGFRFGRRAPDEDGNDRP